MSKTRWTIPWRTRTRTLALTAVLVVPGGAPGQGPMPPTGPLSAADCVTRGGPVRRAVHHVGHALHDKFIGYPENFVEPPLGAALNETFGVMKARADGHAFMLYRTDFVAGTTHLTPGGAQRLTVMAQRLPGWLGPLTVEWTPDQPGLAEARRAAAIALLQRANLAVVPEQIVVGPSPYNGLNGQEAAIDYNVYLGRAAAAPLPGSYMVPPQIPALGTSAFGSGTP